MIQISVLNSIPKGSSIVLLCSKDIVDQYHSVVEETTPLTDFEKCGLSADEINYVRKQIEAKLDFIALNKNGQWIYIQTVDATNSTVKEKERLRREACKQHQNVTLQKIETLVIFDTLNNAELALAFAEGIILSNYQFLKYKDKKEEKQHSLTDLIIVGNVAQRDLNQLVFVTEGVYKARDLVNEPATVMSPEQLASEFEAMGKDVGFEVEVFDKVAIENMKMGGLLAVNRGSAKSPTFSILKWKPADAKNERPVILVGKGITFDTGGHNLKPGNYMNEMKGDMAGGAAVAATIYAIAKSQLPVYVIGLVPSTDNRLSPDAMSPDDIIIMYDGTSVEIGNTDAEGRLIMADALSYSKKYDPELVIDIATLTGSAHRAVGNHGLCAMGNASQEVMEHLKKSGEAVHERLIEFPLWDEYADEIKSDIADLKNIGGENAGMITAGKFLEHFTSYPYIHLDIAGLAFAKESRSYQGKGGTGYGVRLLFEFLKKY